VSVDSTHKSSWILLKIHYCHGPVSSVCSANRPSRLCRPDASLFPGVAVSFPVALLTNRVKAAGAQTARIGCMIPPYGAKASATFQSTRDPVCTTMPAGVRGHCFQGVLPERRGELCSFSTAFHRPHSRRMASAFKHRSATAPLLPQRQALRFSANPALPESHQREPCRAFSQSPAAHCVAPRGKKFLPGPRLALGRSLPLADTACFQQLDSARNAGGLP
jgi:hypothetical protein